MVLKFVLFLIFIAVLKAKDLSVAFFAYLTNDLISLIAETILTFSGIKTSVGNAYNPAYGVLSRPSPELIFSLSPEARNPNHRITVFTFF